MKEMKLHEWAQDMAEQQSSGLSQKKWCETKGIPPTTFRYRCGKVRLAMEAKPREIKSGRTGISPVEKTAEPSVETESKPFFAKVTLSPSHSVPSGMTIQFHEMLVHVAPDAPESHVCRILEAFAHAQ